ncbi:MAG: chloride channel protein [Myxococcaceae bacterium]|nr:chloride channel protein [Myxococcaceae bacterium]MBH2006739.1 chloride channel protein [Myxococcaceae bacterium]
MSIQLRDVAAAFCIGIASGLAGGGLALLLRFVQHKSYAYDSGSFLYGVEQATPEHRIITMFICSLLAGVGWWLFKRFRLIDILLQIVTVGMGSPLGREKAPRELGLLFSEILTKRFDIEAEKASFLHSCAAGAALAAVYNIPLSGALFSIEAIHKKWKISYLLVAVLLSVIAVHVSYLLLGDEPAYRFPSVSLSASLMGFALVFSPIVFQLGKLFAKASDWCSQNARDDWKTVPLCLLFFTLLGGLSTYYPSVLGNGKSPAELEFDSHIGFFYSLGLVLLRVLAPLSASYAGAQGGNLTPAFANGALFGGILGSAWLHLWPGSSIHAFALVCACGFLAASQNLPLTALVMALEFTDTRLEMLFPLAIVTLSVPLSRQYLR